MRIKGHAGVDVFVEESVLNTGFSTDPIAYIRVERGVSDWTPIHLDKKGVKALRRALKELILND